MVEEQLFSGSMEGSSASSSVKPMVSLDADMMTILMITCRCCSINEFQKHFLKLYMKFKKYVHWTNLAFDSKNLKIS